MSRFPIVNSLDASIVKAIENTDKVKFSGTKAFAAIKCFVGSTNVKDGIIGNNSYYDFNYINEVNNFNKRMPAIIKTIDVKTAGTLGAIKKAEVVLQFSNMQEVLNNSGFLQIGKTLLLAWGWTKTRSGNAAGGIGMSVSTALTAINAAKHYNYVKGKDFDIHAGILTNFAFNLNDNLTVDVTLEISQPSDIPAFLALDKKTKKSAVEKTEDESSKGTAVAAQAAKLDPDGDGEAYNKLLGYTINIQDETFDFTFGNTDTPYIQLGYVIKTICNKGKKTTMGDYPVDVQIDEAIATGRRRMLSVSENVIIPCTELPKTLDDQEITLPGSNKKIKKMIVDANTPVTFGPIKLAQNFQFPETKAFTYHNVNFAAYEYGFIKNLFISSDFIKDATKGCENNKQFLEKIVNELNIAGAGLWNLGLRDIENSKGQMVYTIVDYNLSHNLEVPPSINLFSPHSTITNVDLQADMPKEIAGQAMMGGDKQGGDGESGATPGDILFYKSGGTDPVLGAAKQAAANYEGDAPTTENSGEEKKVEDNKTTAKKAIDVVGKVVNAVAGMVSAAVDKVGTLLKKMVNAPGEYRVKINKKPYYSGTEESYFVVVKDAGQMKRIYFGENWGKTKNALLPVKITFTTLGVGGFVVGRALNVPYVPWLNGKGYWQITDIQQKINDNKWEIDVEIRFRVKL